MKTQIQGDWWNNVAIKTSVVLADFKKQMEHNKLMGVNPSQYVYDTNHRLHILRTKRHANV